MFLRRVLKGIQTVETVFSMTMKSVTVDLVIVLLLILAVTVVSVFLLLEPSAAQQIPVVTRAPSHQLQPTRCVEPLSTQNVMCLRFAMGQVPSALPTSTKNLDWTARMTLKASRESAITVDVSAMECSVKACLPQRTDPVALSCAIQGFDVHTMASVLLSPLGLVLGRPVARIVSVETDRASAQQLSTLRGKRSVLQTVQEVELNAKFCAASMMGPL